MVALAGMMCAIAADAAAQSNVPAGRIDVGAGIEWLGRANFGTSDATETTPGGGGSTLFSTSTSLEGAIGFQGHLGVRLSERLEGRVIGAVSQPTLSTQISNDIESAGSVEATDSILQYVIGGGVLWYVPIRTSSRLVPFAAADAAYLRQLHQSRTLVATGQLYRVSGGIKYMFSSRADSRLKGYGLEGEVGFAARVKGVAFDDGAHYSPWVAATLLVRLGSRH